MDYKRSSLPIVGDGWDGWLMENWFWGNLVLLMHSCYDIGGLGIIVSMPTKSMWIKGL
jgi:hypothetical protein